MKNTENQINNMKQQTIGVEIEMNSITRQKAARVSSDKDAMLHSLSSQVSYFSKMIQAKYLQAFIDDLDKRPNVLEAYDEDIWSYLIDKAVVSRDGSITFNFRNGKKIRID